MFGALKPALSKLVFSCSEYMANFKPKRTAAASRGFPATARLSCLSLSLNISKTVADTAEITIQSSTSAVRQSAEDDRSASSTG